MRSTRSIGPLVGLVLVCAGCSSEARPVDGQHGDCAAQVRFGTAVYRGNNLVDDAVPRGRLLGTADVIGCGGVSADAVGTATVYRVAGVAPSTALIAVGQYRGVYVAKTLPVAKWPARLRSRGS